MRTVEIARAEVRFGIEFGSLNERYWQHLDTTLNLVQAAAGALALAGALSNATIAGGAGVVLALVSGMQLALSPARRSVAFLEARRRFHDLYLRATTAGLTLQQIDAELEKLRSEAPQGSRWLNVPAMNIVNEQNGRPLARKLKLRERLALALA